MSENTSNLDVACTLPDDEAEDRLQFIHTVLGTRYVGAEERTDGYALTFDGVEETIAALARFVTNEHQCCSFAEYMLTISPPYDETELTITGPDGTKELVGHFIDEVESNPTENKDQRPEEDFPSGPEEQRTVVREQYADVAKTASDRSQSCCGDTDPSDDDVDEKSRLMGYSDDDLESVTADANLGLGCGNPTGIASLTEGDIVVDLGSGAGFDCFLAAQEVGDEGRVIGVDMTPEMVSKARENVENNEVSNVEFRLGEIEYLPVADESVDVIISNCVIHLSPNKEQVFKEAFRVLRPGGRLAISDIVATAELPEEIRTNPSSVASCIGGGASIDELESMLRESGFEEIEIEPKKDSAELIRGWDPNRDLSDYLVSVTIEGTKPEP